MNDIISLKYWFVNFSGVLKKHEAYKTWARWLITHQSLAKHSHDIIPDKGIESDIQLMMELISKGSEPHHARFHYNTLIKLISQLLIRMNSKKFNDDTNVDRMSIAKIHSNYIYRKDHGKIAVSNYLISRMKMIYNQPAIFFNNDLYDLAYRYSILDGVSLQWSIPIGVYKILKDYFNCNTELFASPFNAKLPRYYSLFEEDKKFGSLGNFFNEPLSSFHKGCYEINPPFIDCMFTKISNTVLSLLNFAEEKGQSLTFIYIMPDWSNFEGYDVLVNSNYNRKEIVLRRGGHYYFQADRGIYVKASFTTKIMFMSTNYRVCSDTISSQLVRAFTHY